MSRSDQEDDWVDEVQHHDGFVLNEGVLNAACTYLQTHGDMDIPDRHVTYRRAHVEAQFMTSRFDSQTEDLFETHSSEKVVLMPSPATLQNLENKSSSVLDSCTMQPKLEDFGHDAALSGEVANKSQVFMPTEEVPNALEVGFHQVNPMFESCESADVIYRTLHEAMRALDVEISCCPNWTMDGYAQIAAEEVFLSVHLHRLAVKSITRVDFNLRSGDELRFLELTDSIRKNCRAIDKDMIGLPELSFDVMTGWSTPGELFSGSHPIDSQELSTLLFELKLECPPFTRYEVAKRLKELCQYDYNRRAFINLLKDQFAMGLQSMLQDENEDIVRFAIFTILSFADDVSTLDDLKVPRLPETLRNILTLSQKNSTKKLANDLYKAIGAVN